MNNISYKLEKIRLKLKNPFTIAHGRSLFRESIILTLRYKDYTGYGEAPIVPYYDTSESTIIEEIKLNIKKLKMLNSLEESEHKLKQFHFRSSFAECAFTTSLFDILARFNNRGFGDYLGVHSNNDSGPFLFKTSYTIAYGPVEDMIEAVDKSPSNIIKIKIGFPDDIERLKSILKILTDKNEYDKLTIRLDANQGWPPSKTSQKIESLNYLAEKYYKYGIFFEMLEEPIKTSFKNISRIAGESRVPIFLDENIKSIEDLTEIIATAGNIGGIVAKTGKTGGPVKTIELIRKAKSCGFKVMIGGFIESSLGTTASAFLAPECDFVDLDSPLLIKNDPFCGIKYNGSRVELPPTAGKVCGLGIKKCKN